MDGFSARLELTRPAAESPPRETTTHAAEVRQLPEKASSRTGLLALKMAYVEEVPPRVLDPITGGAIADTEWERHILRSITECLRLTPAMPKASLRRTRPDRSASGGAGRPCIRRRANHGTGEPLIEHRPVFEVVDGSIAFGGNQALDSVSFAMAKGQLVGLIGPNGSGKTTLLNATSGIYPLDSGSIRFEGRPIEKVPPHGIARAGIARTFQIARIFPRMTALENMLTPGFTTRAGASENRIALLRRAKEYLDFVDIADFAHEQAADLSGGQRMLLQFARALMLKPRLMLLDEPFGGIHPLLVERILGRIRDLRAQGIDFIVVSHDLPAIMGLATRIVVLANGRLIADGTPAAVREDPGVIEAYLGG